MVIGIQRYCLCLPFNLDSRTNRVFRGGSDVTICISLEFRVVWFRSGEHRRRSESGVSEWDTVSLSEYGIAMR